VSSPSHRRLTGRLVIDFTICIPAAEAEDDDSVIDHVISDEKSWTDVDYDLETVEEYNP
jgi:hypothetical protein